MRYFSIIKWGEDAALINPQNISYDAHKTLEAAHQILTTLTNEGMGCQGKHFPVWTKAVKFPSKGDVVEVKDRFGHVYLIMTDGTKVHLAASTISYKDFNEKASETLASKLRVLRKAGGAVKRKLKAVDPKLIADVEITYGIVNHSNCFEHINDNFYRIVGHSYVEYVDYSSLEEHRDKTKMTFNMIGVDRTQIRLVREHQNSSSSNHATLMAAMTAMSLNRTGIKNKKFK